MRNHQRYFAMEDAAGKLANRVRDDDGDVVKDPAVVAQRQRDACSRRACPTRSSSSPRTARSIVRRVEREARRRRVPGQARRRGQDDRPQGRAASTAIVDGARRRRARPSRQRGRAAVQGRPRVARGRRVPRAAGRDGQALRAARRRARRRSRDAIERALVAEGAGRARCRRPRGARWSRSPIAWTRSSAASRSASSRRGSADPFGLRRAAIGIWQILLDRGWRRTIDSASMRSRARRQLAAQGVDARQRPRASSTSSSARACAASSSSEGIAAAGRRRRARRRTATIRSTRAPARARCAKIPQEAREVFKRVANILDDARAKKLDDPAQRRPGAVRRRRRRAQPVRRAIAAGADASSARARAARLRGGVRGRSRSSSPTVAAFFDKGGVMVMDPDPAARQPARAAPLDLRRRSCDRATSGCSAGAVVKWVRQFGGGTAEGRAQGQGAARRQGREPRRDGVARPAGAARLHDHDRGLPLRDGARRGQLSRRASPREVDEALARVEELTKHEVRRRRRRRCSSACARARRRRCPG